MKGLQFDPDKDGFYGTQTLGTGEKKCDFHLYKSKSQGDKL